MKDLAKGLASLGRHGDSMLMHVHPAEVAGLQALANAHGTSLTINPDTGMPEAFNLLNAIGSLAPTLVGMALAPATGGASLGLTGMAASAAPLVGGALTGAAIAGAKGENPLMGALTGGLGGYGGSGLAGNITNFGTAPTAQVAQPITSLPNTTTALGTPTYDLAPLNPQGAGIQLGGKVLPSQATSADLGFNPVAEPAKPTLASTSITPPSFSQGLSNVMDKPMDFLSQNKMAVGLPLGMAGLAGLEPSDLYPGMNVKEEKYDPNKTLNLSGDTGLRLLAEGGMVSGGLSSLYANPDGTMAQNTPYAQGYGAGRLENIAQQYSPGYARGGYLDGPGDGVSDSIPAIIADKQPARLADGEFVLPARIVSEIGNGSTKAGAKRLYAMMDRIQKRRDKTTGKDGIAVDSKAYKELYV